jgi:urease subunit gamma/beta
MVENKRVELTPTEQDRLLLFTAGQLAKSRLARGLKLNKPEAVAIICNAVIEAARDGASHSEALAAGQNALSPDDLLPGVSALLSGISVEAVFSDGRRLVVINFESNEKDYPGKVTRLESFEAPEVKPTVIAVKNESAVPVAVTSHMHFMEVNPKLRFKRESAYGMRLIIPSGTHVDFPPNEIVRVELIPIEGNRVVIGFAGIIDGDLANPNGLEIAMQRLNEFGYLTGEPV